MGIRVVKNGIFGYACTSDLNFSSIISAVKIARSIANASNNSKTFTLAMRESHIVSRILKPCITASEEAKINLLERANNSARENENYISQVIVKYNDYQQNVQIFNTDGVWAKDTRNLIEFSVRVIAKKGDMLQTVVRGKGGQYGLEIFDTITPDLLQKMRAQLQLKCLMLSLHQQVPMTVVINNGIGDGGVLIHEACGHALESDFIVKKILYIQI